jgi:hypothetical protein
MWNKYQVMAWFFWMGIGLLMVWAGSTPRSKEYLSVRDIILEDRKKK